MINSVRNCVHRGRSRDARSGSRFRGAGQYAPVDRAREIPGGAGRPQVGGPETPCRLADYAKTAKREGASWTVMLHEPRNLGQAFWVIGAGTRPFLSLRGPFENDEHHRSISARYTTRQIVPCDGRMMEPSRPPLDPETGAALGVRVIDDID